MRVAAVIPARMQSARLPGKPLLRIAGVPMILRVLDRARACKELRRVIVATDSEEIYRTVEASGGEGWMTSPHHRTGSDRVAEVAAAVDAFKASRAEALASGVDVLARPEGIEPPTRGLEGRRSVR